jgi:hypothetical protein
MKPRFRLVWPLLGFASLCAVACASDSNPVVVDAGAGGASSGGGSSTGGASASGGAGSNTGGASATGGAPGNGGKAGTGGKGVSSGGAIASGGSPASGGAPASGGTTASGGASASGGAPASGGASSASGCERTDLVWKTARKTNYTSYPDPGSEECVEYNGCTWAGQFAACNGKKPEAWVEAHDIAAAFPDFNTLKLHDLCLRAGSKTLVVTVLDTCGDSDCSGCCTRNKGNADQLIDLESYTNARWGVPDGAIEWADLGPTKTAGCN